MDTQQADAICEHVDERGACGLSLETLHATFPWLREQHVLELCDSGRLHLCPGEGLVLTDVQLRLSGLTQADLSLAGTQPRRPTYYQPPTAQ